MKNVFLLAVLTPILALTVILAPHSAVAQTCIPEGTTIDSAIFSVYLTSAPGNTVNVHRITAPWDEMTVTWNTFGESYDPTIEGSFVANTSGWHSVDLTALVQDWLDGVYSNYGILLEQGLPYALSEAKSSEDTTPALRPELEICYTTSSGQTCIIIQRPGIEQDGVADADIWSTLPDHNTGDYYLIRCGLGQYGQKQALVWFDICQDGNGTCEELGTPGYWKNHPEAWPVETLILGAYSYTKAELLAILDLSTKKDASIILAHQLIAAKLNILAGSDPDPVSDAIIEADDLLDDFGGPLPYEIRQNSDLGQDMISVKTILDSYNNGYLTGDCIPPTS